MTKPLASEDSVLGVAKAEMEAKKHSPGPDDVGMYPVPLPNSEALLFKLLNTGSKSNPFTVLKINNKYIKAKK